jgi:hypothetical protein
MTKNPPKSKELVLSGKGIFAYSFYIYSKITHMPLDPKNLTYGIRGNGVF